MNIQKTTSEKNIGDDGLLIIEQQDIKDNWREYL